MSSQGGPIATGERLQFAHDLFDRHAEEVYHYVLAWTGEQASAVDLTTTVLRTAVARMDQLTESADGAELEMRLIALVRAAVIRWRGRRPGEPTVATAVPEESLPLFEALGDLDDDQHEVLILTELLGHDPERAGRLLGLDAAAVREQRDEALEALWRALNGAPPQQAVPTWDRLTVATALRRAAGGWLGPAGAVLAYLSGQLFGEAPVGVPAAAPGRAAGGKRASKGAAGAPGSAWAGAAALAAKGAAPAPSGARGAVAMAKVAPPGTARARGGAAASAAGAEAAGTAGAEAAGTAAGALDAAAGKGAAPTSPAAAAKAAAKVAPAAAEAGARNGAAGPWRAIAGVLALLRGRWAAWGVAAAAAATLGVVAALTVGGPVSGSSQCAGRLGCLPSTTAGQASGNAGEVVPAPTDGSGNALPSTTAGPGTGRASGFPLISGRSTTTGRATTTTRRGSDTTVKPSVTTRPPTTRPPTTAPPTTAPPTTAPPTTAPPTTDPPTTV